MANNYSNKYQPLSSFKNILFAVFLVVMAGVTYYFANSLMHKNQTLSVGAASGKADLFFEPAAIALPPDGLVNLWVTTDKQLGFASVELSFNPALLKLTQEITLPTAALKRVVKQTSMAEANTTGKIALVLAIDPSTVATAPTGNFALAGLKFATKSTTSNQSATISVATSNLQLVDTSATPFTVTSKNANFTINPSATPTATPVSTSNAGPTITVKSPAQNSVIPSGGVWIGSVASDPDGVLQTIFTFDGAVVKTCGVKDTTCNFTYKGTVAPGTHQIVIESTDNSSAKNKSQAKITVTK